MITETIAGRYSLEREIGRGATATVYMAVDQTTGNCVAVKMLRPELVGSIQSGRFEREIRLTARLDHPRLLPVLDSGTDGDRFYFVLPYMDGGTLRARLRRDRQLPVREAIGICRSVAEGLAYAHALGFVHRDVKPENILFSEGEAHLADFGIARALEHVIGDVSTSTGVVRGTVGYMSPEQAGGERNYDGRSDIFSLGCVLYEMIAGVPAFIAATPELALAQRFLHAPRELRVYRPGASAALNAVVMKCLAIAAADRFQTAQDLLGALKRVEATLDDAPAPRIWRRRPVQLISAAVLLVAGIAGADLLRRARASHDVLDDRLVAVAPFDVYDSTHRLWREGFLDVLSSSLDGAGRLRTVSPAVIARRWRGPGQRSSAIALALATRARYAVFGRFLSAGEDSIRATAIVVDARSGHEVATIEAYDVSGRPDRLADSVAMRAVRELGESIDHSTRVASLGAASLGALKAYLEGEYYLRRTQWDSATDAYTRALALDSTFALANWRMKTAVWSRRWGPDTAGDSYALRAGRLNHGLAPRESLLIVIDSIWASLNVHPASAWPRISRLSSTLDEAARRYPDDPWVWYKVGEARFHLPIGLDHPLTEHLAAFDRAIALDSGFALAYVTHAVELALIVDGPERALRYARGYHLAALPGVEDSAGTLTERLLDSTAAPASSTAMALDRASADVLYRVTANLGMWFDDRETAVGTARRLRRAVGGSPRFLARDTRELRLAHVLAVRGHLGEAWRHLRDGVPLRDPDDEAIELFSDLAMTGTVPAPSADSVFSLWTRGSPRGTVFALPWWAQRGDTTAIAGAVRVFQAWSREASTHDIGEYGRLAARGYLAVARGDSAGAVPLFAELSDSLCADCYAEWFTRALLSSAAGQWKSARRDLERVMTYAWILPTYPMAALSLGHVAERLGDLDLARRSYRTTAAAWAHGDSTSRGAVKEATEALYRMQAR